MRTAGLISGERTPGLITQPEALQSQDQAIREFAQSLEPNYLIFDMRNVEPGMGFSWSRYGHKNSESKRFGEERIFAYSRPEAKRGFFARLFGK